MCLASAECCQKVQVSGLEDSLANDLYIRSTTTINNIPSYFTRNGTYQLWFSGWTNLESTWSIDSVNSPIAENTTFSEYACPV